MPVVVSDTSPTRCLSHLGLLDVLERLFGHVVVPPAVRDELLRPRPRFVALDVSTTPWITVRQPVDAAAVAVLAKLFGPGESEAIVLARRRWASNF